MEKKEILVFSGNATLDLARDMCEHIGTPMGRALIGRFMDSETRVEIESNVRGRDVFVVQSTCAPANENIMELLLIVDALKRASAQSITAVLPYYGYGRQERKSAPRTPISAKLVADLLVTAGVNRVLTLELHASAIQGFFNIPVDHLFSKPIFFDHLSKMNFPNPLIVSPDAGGVERARALAKLMDCGLAIVDKRRDKPGTSKAMNVIGDVTDRSVILLDDICDTAGTLTQGAEALMERGAKQVFAAITHPIFSGPALDRIQKSPIKKVFVTDSIPLSEAARLCDKIQVLSVAKLLATAVQRIHNSDSVSNLFI